MKKANHRMKWKNFQPGIKRETKSQNVFQQIKMRNCAGIFTHSRWCEMKLIEMNDETEADLKFCT